MGILMQAYKLWPGATCAGILKCWCALVAHHDLWSFWPHSSFRVLLNLAKGKVTQFFLDCSMSINKYLLYLCPFLWVTSEGPFNHAHLWEVFISVAFSFSGSSSRLLKTDYRISVALLKSCGMPDSRLPGEVYGKIRTATSCLS